MVLFAVAFVVALLGIGAYDLYNPGARPITMASYHFAAVAIWVPVALGALVPLTFFLLHALWTGLHIWWLKGAVRRVRRWDDLPQWPAVERRVQPVPVERPLVRERPAREWPSRERPTRQLPAREWSVRERPGREWSVREPPAREWPAVEAQQARPRRRRASQGPTPSVSPQPAPKRSWLNRD